MTSAAVLDSEDFYERLGVARDASLEEVKRAYRALVRQYTPERDAERFKRIREAYETLSNPRSREEYNARPNNEAARWIAAGLEAMQAKNYASAERFFKQGLLLEPEIGYVRNLLGLCFLYQGEPSKAIAQFARLLGEPDAPASWFANAGHAYLQLKRHHDAELAFREAIRRSSESPAEYVVTLADVFIEQGQLDRAARELAAAIQADGVVDFQDLRCLMKLLEVRLLERNRAAVDTNLKVITGIAADEEQRRYTARRLGILAQQLLEVQGFSFASAVAQAAMKLQPDDADYGALARAGELLDQNNFKALRNLLADHPSFQPDGWLATCGQHVRSYMAKYRGLEGMRPVSTPPTLWTVNGIGTTLYGSRDQDATTGSYVATLFFVVLFIPVVPLACYRVISRGDKKWSFIGRVPFADRERLHLAAAVCAAFFLLCSYVTSAGTPSPSSTSAYTTSPSTSPAAAANPFVTLAGAPYAPAGTARPSTSNADDGKGDDDDLWYENERGRIQRLEREVDRLDAELELARSDIESQKAQIRAIEGGYGTTTADDPEYARLLRSHNLDVDQYNAKLQYRRARYREYKQVLEHFNARVSAHNARLRR